MEFTDREVQIRVLPSNDGPLAAVVRSPVIVVQGLSGRLAPLEASIPAGSLRVEPDGIPEGDRSKIEEAIRRKILKADRFPWIRFQGTEVARESGSLVVRGSLTLHGQSAPLEISFRESSPGKFFGELVLRQSAFGIVPLTAFLGALRSRDEVRIEITMALPGLVDR